MVIPSLFVVLYGLAMFILGTLYERSQFSKFSRATAACITNALKREWTAHGWHVAERIFKRKHDAKGRFQCKRRAF